MQVLQDETSLWFVHGRVEKCLCFTPFTVAPVALSKKKESIFSKVVVLKGEKGKK